MLQEHKDHLHDRAELCAVVVSARYKGRFPGQRTTHLEHLRIDAYIHARTQDLGLSFTTLMVSG